MKKKEKFFNILFVASIISVIISAFILILGTSYLDSQCFGRVCSNPFFAFYGNYRISLDNMFIFLVFITLIPVVLLIIHFIKNKSILKIIISVIMLISLIGMIKYDHADFNDLFENSNYQNPSKDKPIIYIYPKEEMDLTIKLGNEKVLNTTYPKYEDGWNIHVKEDGTIYDYKTKRNYYALFWDAKDNSKVNMKEGFVVKGKDITKFLEEKLELLGLNEKEIEEFIIYWLPQMENNKYNYIRFETSKEINKYMPLKISEKPDTLIRIMMDFKPLKKKVKVKEQKLEPTTRNGYTIVEWGGRKLK